MEEEVLVENVGRDNAGIYTCTAHNTLGVSGPKEIVLDVECKYCKYLEQPLKPTCRLAAHNFPRAEWVNLKPCGRKGDPDLLGRREPQARVPVGAEAE